MGDVDNEGDHVCVDLGSIGAIFTSSPQFAAKTTLKKVKKKKSHLVI